MLNEKHFKKIKEVIVPEYIHQVKLSDSRRAKYFSNITGLGRIKREFEKLPKKCNAVAIDLDGFWLDKNGKKIIANSRSAGKANYVPINSQLLYKSVHHAIRNKIMAELHGYWDVIFKKHLPFTPQEYPLFITIDWYCPKTYHTKDIDNFTYINEKAIFDALHENGLIPDDTVDYIIGQASLFHEIEHFEDRKLVISFYSYMEPNQLKLL